MSSHFLDGISSQILTKHVAQPIKHRMKAPNTNIITVGDPNGIVHVFIHTVITSIFIFEIYCHLHTYNLNNKTILFSV